MRIRQISDRERVDRVLLFVNLGFKDYLAARVLLNNGLILQGAIQASSTIEKHFKAIIALRGNEARGHLRKAHLASIKNYDSNLFGELNSSFLEMLQIVYDLRYLDNPKFGFTLTLERWPILAEIDIAVSRIQQKLTFSRKDERLRTMYDAAVEDKDPRLFENNHVLSGISKEEFLARRDVVYGIRIDETWGLLEVFYEVENASADGNFLKPGLVPGSGAGARLASQF